jgi:hypothetical protein
MDTLALARTKSVEAATATVDRSLDLANVRMKLRDTGEGPGLPLDIVDTMEREYRRFLVLHLLYPDSDLVPCKVVDEMWHQHILDTAAYRADCDLLFGGFLDHFPYFGMRGEDDACALEDAYAETVHLYCEAFGQPADDTWMSVEASSKCKRTACKPMKCR